MARNLTNKQTETLAKRLAEDIVEKTEKAVKKHPATKKALAKYRTLVKKAEKADKEATKCKDDIRAFCKDFNKTNKVVRMKPRHYHWDDIEVIPCSFAEGIRSRWDLQKRIEEDITIEYILQDSNVDAVMEVLTERYSI
jgi:hypothetical protein